MPNPFLRFMTYFATHEPYKYQFESPSKAEAVVLFSYEGGIIRAKYKMPEGYQEQWEREYRENPNPIDSDDSNVGSDEDDWGENADMAFNEQYGDENGYIWEYIPFERDHPLGDEIQQLGNLGIVRFPIDEMSSFHPVISMQHVFYSLMVLGWKTVYEPEYPDVICSVCTDNIATSKCNRCAAPICSQACFLDRHHC